MKSLFHFPIKHPKSSSSPNSSGQVSPVLATRGNPTPQGAQTRNGSMIPLSTPTIPTFSKYQQSITPSIPNRSPHVSHSPTASILHLVFPSHSPYPQFTPDFPPRSQFHPLFPHFSHTPFLTFRQSVMVPRESL
jgi:hypothetical protein